jgi:nitroreductase
MNHTLKIIKNRRSIRAYKTEQVKEDDLNAILEAGAYAPSAINGQRWHFTVVQNKKVLDEMTAAFKKYVGTMDPQMAKRVLENPDFRIFHGAPTGIIVSGAQDRPEYAAMDCAAAVENMLLAAESLGYGACWMQMPINLFNSAFGGKSFEEARIPEGYKPLYALSLGHPSENPAPAPRRENIVTFIR